MNKPKAKSSKTFAIRHKKTGEYFVSESGKNAWRSTGAAKNAFAYHGASGWHRSDDAVIAYCEKYKMEPLPIDKHLRYGKVTLKVPYFDEQNSWEIVELSANVEDCGRKLKRAEELLQDAMGQVDSSLFGEISKYFSEK